MPQWNQVAPTLTPKATEDLAGVEAVGVIEVTASFVSHTFRYCMMTARLENHWPAPVLRKKPRPHFLQLRPRELPGEPERLSYDLRDHRGKRPLEDCQERMLCNLPRA